MFLNSAIFLFLFNYLLLILDLTAWFFPFSLRYFSWIKWSKINLSQTRQTTHREWHDGDSITATVGEGTLLEKELDVLRDHRTFHEVKTSNLLSLSLLPAWSHLLIPLTYTRVVVLAMRVVGIRSSAAMLSAKYEIRIIGTLLQNYHDFQVRHVWSRYILASNVCHERPFFRVVTVGRKKNRFVRKKVEKKPNFIL